MSSFSLRSGQDNQFYQCQAQKTQTEPQKYVILFKETNSI